MRFKPNGFGKINTSNWWYETSNNKVEFSKDTVIQLDANPEPYHVNLRHYFHQYGKEVYQVNCEMLEIQPTQYKLDSVRSQDSVHATRQYFFTKHWLFSYREHDNIDSLRLMPFTEFSSTPGYAYFKNGDTLRRHTKKFIKKYYQVRAKDTTFNTIDTLRIWGNTKMIVP